MGRSQRRKVMNQGVAADGELWAQGVGVVPPATTHDLGFPNNAGVPPDVPPPPQTFRATALEAEPPQYPNAPLTYASAGGPLQGSLVQGPKAAGGTDPAPPIPMDEPLPVLDSIDPTEAAIGDADLTLTCRGSGFTLKSRIYFNNGEEPTTFVSETELTTTVRPSTASTPGSYPVQVRSSTAKSGDQMFTFTEAEAPPPEE